MLPLPEVAVKVAFWTVKTRLMQTIQVGTLAQIQAFEEGIRRLWATLRAMVQVTFQAELRAMVGRVIAFT